MSLITKEREVRERRAAETILGVIDEREALESRMRGNVHVRFGGRRMEKGAVGCPSLPMHHGRTNSDVSRNLASRLPYLVSDWSDDQAVGIYRELTMEPSNGRTH